MYRYCILGLVVSGSGIVSQVAILSLLDYLKLRFVCFDRSALVAALMEECAV